MVILVKDKESTFFPLRGYNITSKNSDFLLYLAPKKKEMNPTVITERLLN